MCLSVSIRSKRTDPKSGLLHPEIADGHFIREGSSSTTTPAEVLDRAESARYPCSRRLQGRAARRRSSVSGELPESRVSGDRREAMRSWGWKRAITWDYCFTPVPGPGRQYCQSLHENSEAKKTTARGSWAELHLLVPTEQKVLNTGCWRTGRRLAFRPVIM